VQLTTQQCGSAEKSRLQDVKRADIVTGADEDLGELQIFIKKNIRNHSYHQFYPVLAKIRIKRGLLYICCQCIITSPPHMFFSTFL